MQRDVVFKNIKKGENNSSLFLTGRIFTLEVVVREGLRKVEKSRTVAKKTVISGNETWNNIRLH